MEKDSAVLGLQQKMSKLILALDQSTQKSGWAIYNPDNNSLVDYGKIEPTGDIWSRIISLRDWVRFTILSQNITTLVIEEIQLQNIPGTSREGNVATFKKLAFVQAILIELAINLNIKYEIMPSSRWKSVCGIKGTKRTEQKKNATRF